MADKVPDAAASAALKALSTVLSRNLRRHSAPFDSISAVCRASGINRQQFNKYLSGETLPSLANLVKIADALGVGLDALVTPLTAKAQTSSDPASGFPGAEAGDGLEISTGYYLDYTTSSVFKDSMMVALARISRSNSGYVYRGKLRCRVHGLGHGRVQNFIGRAFASPRAVYINYMNKAEPSDVVCCILQPEVRYSADMVGLRSEVSPSSPSIPIVGSFYLRYLGENIDLRAALRQCGVFPLDSLDEIQSRIYTRLSAKTRSSRNVMRVSDI